MKDLHTKLDWKLDFKFGRYAMKFLCDIMIELLMQPSTNSTLIGDVTASFCCLAFKLYIVTWLFFFIRSFLECDFDKITDCKLITFSFFLLFCWLGRRSEMMWEGFRSLPFVRYGLVF